MYCISYVIKEDDTLYKISRHFNISIKVIMEANPLVNVYQLVAGDIIYLPVSVPQSNYTKNAAYLIKENDTLGSVLDENSINLADLMEFNDLYEVYLMPGATINIPMIGEGDTGVIL